MDLSKRVRLDRRHPGLPGIDRTTGHAGHRRGGAAIVRAERTHHPGDPGPGHHRSGSARSELDHLTVRILIGAPVRAASELEGSRPPELGAVRDVLASFLLSPGELAKFFSRLRRQVVNYATREAPGTIIIETHKTYLYLVREGKVAKSPVRVQLEDGVQAMVSLIEKEADASQEEVTRELNLNDEIILSSQGELTEGQVIKTNLVKW